MEAVKRTRYNKETIAAVEEARRILNGERQAKSYSCAKELFDEIEAEFRAEQRRGRQSGNASGYVAPESNLTIS